MPQYKHLAKPGGHQNVKPGEWVTIAGLPLWANNGRGVIDAQLYLNISYTDDAAYPGGGVVEARVVRRKWRGKYAPVDPTGADTRPLTKRLGQCFARFQYRGPIRSGEAGRSYYWQIRIRGVKSARISTRYADWWRTEQ